MLNNSKYRSAFGILQLFVSKPKWHEILQMADNEDTIILWAADIGVHWPIETLGLKIRILLLKYRTRLRFSPHLQEALRFVTSVLEILRSSVWVYGMKGQLPVDNRVLTLYSSYI